MTSAVCDSGPLTHLWQIGQWQAFRTFNALHVPEQVAREVARHVSLAQLTVVTGCDVSVDAVSEQEIAAARRTAPAILTLHEADLATLALARRQAPGLVLTDDLATRQAVEARGQTPMGSVGVPIAEIAATFEAALQRVGARRQSTSIVESFVAILDDAIGVAQVHPKASEALLASVAIRLGG